MKKKSSLFWFVVLVLCVFIACLSTNYDYDFFARLIVGERFIEEGILPFKDFLSYTPTHPWYDHEWGSGVIFYLILKYLKPLGIVLFQAIMFFGITFFVVKTQRLKKHAYPISLLFVLIFVYLLFQNNPLLIRCQLLTFLMFSVFLYILEKQRIKGTRLIWLIPFLTIFWNNVHGGVVSGLGLIFMYLVGSLIERKDFKKYLAALAISSCVLIINPYGIKYLKFLFSAVTMERKYTVEWWPSIAYIHFKQYFFTNIFCLLGFITAFVEVIKKRTDITKLMVVLVTSFLGFAHAKLLPLALIAISALYYNEIFKKFIFCKKLFIRIEKSLYPAILILALLIPLLSPTAPRADFKVFPLLEAEFLRINNIKGNIVVPFGMGSYISYKLYPDNFIYMDGRYEEVYNNKEFLTLRDFTLSEPNWQDIVKNYDTDILMVEKNVDVYKTLTESKDWVRIFEGYRCGIFVKKDEVKDSYIPPKKDKEYYRNIIFKSFFTKKLEDNKE